MNPQGIELAYTRTSERRSSSQLVRSHFDAALTLLKPLLRSAESLNGTSLYRAMSQLQKIYPDLNDHEIEALVAATVRTLQSRGGNGA
jgi:phage gp29-like protein